MISPGIFSYFLILIFWAVRGIKGQKKPKMKSNNYICHVPYLRNSIAYDHDFWYTCVKWWYFHVCMCVFVFFHFFKVLIFWTVSGVNGERKVQNEKKFCLSHSISQEPYIIWFSFVVHMYKMIISPGVFFIQNFNFPGCWTKKVQKDKKFCLSPSISQEAYIIWLSSVVVKCKMMISVGFFFSFFQNFDFSGWL